LTSIGKFRKKPLVLLIVRAINTYAGNNCDRKCFNHDEILFDCREKFEELAKQFGQNPITVSEFYRLMNAGAITICKLPEKKRRAVVIWMRLEQLQDNGTDFWDLD